MAPPELAHLELLAEVDELVAELSVWADSAPDWAPARKVQALVRRLIERADSLRVRMQAPLVVATLGGTGTGKSSLVNALVGAEVAEAGRQRPTTRRPVLVCRPDVTPQALGIPPDAVGVVARDLPALRDLVLVDCPDPDTTEDATEAGTNLARLRRLLPYCDVLLVTATQQKYRSARVLDELADAAPGAHLVFVQTHADVDEDIRADWRKILSERYEPGEFFAIDTQQALADAQAGIEPRGDFARLVDLLTRSLSGAAAGRIRRANFLDLVDETLGVCGTRLDGKRPLVEQFETAIADQRARLAGQLSRRMREELLASRRQWENRLVGEIAGRWGFSPFALVLRAYQGLGGLLTGALLLRMRSPAQMALWGALEGGRALRRRQQQSRAAAGPARAVAGSFDSAELRTAAIIVAGYATEAGCRNAQTDVANVEAEAAAAANRFVATAGADLQALVARLARRHTGWFTRWRYELLLLAVAGVLLYRLGRNFFYDSWLAAEPQPLLGLDFFVTATFFVVLWCGILLWAFTGRVRRGLRGEINTLAESWNTPASAADVFAGVEEQCCDIRRFDAQLAELRDRVARMRARLEQPEPRLGHRIG